MDSGMRPSYLYRITLRQIEIFLAVCRSRHFSRAAEELALTQPAVSAQIRQLEKLVGEPLFHYVGKQVQITGAGEVMMRAARDLQQRLVTVEMELAELRGAIQGTLNIAVESGAQYFMPALIARFRAEYSAISVAVEVANRDATLKRLYDNRQELVIAGSPPQDRAVQFTPFRDNELVAIARPDHPWREQAQVSLLQLSQQELLIREPGSGTRLILEELAREQAVKLEHTQQYGSLEAIKAAVRSGAGLAIVPLDCAREDIARGALIALPLEHGPLRRSWCALHLRRRQLTPVSQRFLQFVLGGQQSG
ncbi:MAG: LysR family transcriptional regulator [Halioglobus sp.]|nr:LysR family transcriptional regulator [Halioglobus sp.]